MTRKNLVLDRGIHLIGCEWVILSVVASSCYVNADNAEWNIQFSLLTFRRDSFFDIHIQEKLIP